MYVCGPTVYGPPHIGHGRFSLVYDVVRRYLAFLGLDVRHVCNVTDVDDKIIERAAREGRTPADVSAESEAQWWEAMDALGALRPTDVPHATAYVRDMVALVADLVRRGVAYETEDGVYMSVEAVPGYGLLAHQDLGSLRAGARVESAETKRSPLDFALWKKAKPGEPTWDSPWGPGRPGWHTECVVMSLDLLGESFDLHGGGQDLIFPHHENERAQAVAGERAFARHWLHYALIMVRGQKMSKSLGNFTTVSDLLGAHDPRAYRMLVLRAHYRSPIEVSPETLADAERALERLDALARRLSLRDPFAGASGGALERESAVAGTEHGVDEQGLRDFVERMDDDLDVPGAMADVFGLVTRANAAADAGDARGATVLGDTVAVLCGAVGLRLRAEVGELDAETRAMVVERDEARSARDFARADAIRDRLTAAGWVVQDGADGTVLHR